MTSGGTRRFGVGWARAQLTVWLLLALVQALTAVNAWRDAGGPDVWALLWLSIAAISVLNALSAQAGVVRVGGGRLAWGFGRRRHDLAFDEIADIRRHPQADRSEVVTTDGRVLRLPLQPHHGSEVWHLVLGDRTPSAT
jgi:hypothetical protein